jgi:hypothetical protein
LIETLLALDQAGQNVILIGVTFALLDLIEKVSITTYHHHGNGGMKVGVK